MQNGEPGGLYCADESDGESLRVCEQINEALLGYEINGTEVVEVLAESYEPNDDLTEWTFTLREGVTFHDGSPFDANDVVESYRVVWDAADPRHVGRTGEYVYWGGLLRRPSQRACRLGRARFADGPGRAGLASRPTRSSAGDTGSWLASSLAGFSTRSRCSSGSSWPCSSWLGSCPATSCRATLGERATDELCDAFREENGLNESIFVQFGVYAGNLLTGDLGESLQHRRSVSQLMIERLPVTLQLSVAALLLAIHGRHPGRGHRRLPAQLGDRRGRGRRVERRGVDTGVRARPVPAVRLRQGAGRHDPRPPAVGPADARASSPSRSTRRGGSRRNDVFEFISNIDTVNAVLTLNWEVLWDAIRHLVLPAVTLATIPDRHHRAHDPVEPARHARARLRADRPGQGPAGAGGRRPPRAAQLAAAGGDRDRAVARHAARRGHPDRDHLQPDRRGQDALRRHRGP